MTLSLIPSVCSQRGGTVWPACAGRCPIGYMKKIYLIVLLILILVFVLWKALHVSVFIVPTKSMEPYISLGSLILISPIRNPSVDDVISYRYKNMSEHVVTHRIVEVQNFGDKNLYITKGDANEFADPVPVSQNEIIGRVFLAIPHLGDFLPLLLTPWALGIFFYAPIGFVIGKSVRSAFDSRGVFR